MLKILFIKKKFLSQELAKESLDMVLAGIDLDLKVSLLLMDDAVLYLSKSRESVFSALGDSDLEKVYVVQESLTARDLTAADLIMPATVVSMAQVAEVVVFHDRVL